MCGPSLEFGEVRERSFRVQRGRSFRIRIGLLHWNDVDLGRRDKMYRLLFGQTIVHNRWRWCCRRRRWSTIRTLYGSIGRNGVLMNFARCAGRSLFRCTARSEQSVALKRRQNVRFD